MSNSFPRLAFHPGPSNYLTATTLLGQQLIRKESYHFFRLTKEHQHKIKSAFTASPREANPLVVSSCFFYLPKSVFRIVCCIARPLRLPSQSSNLLPLIRSYTKDPSMDTARGKPCNYSMGNMPGYGWESNPLEVCLFATFCIPCFADSKTSSARELVSAELLQSEQSIFGSEQQQHEQLDRWLSAWAFCRCKYHN